MVLSPARRSRPQFAADIARMRMALAEMHAVIDADDPTAFVKANWDLHAAIARVSPDTVVPTLYLNLLEFIESHTCPSRAPPTNPCPTTSPHATNCTSTSSTPSTGATATPLCA
ncbi:FCD domain-containing protein (plasmid) [Rhodococcus aetherivorans]|uniref:FCD domain-containing protein n=1 Tax=Rhodococcus aetherivorans TaxID=191292 RepID=UPI0012DF2DEF|nr:FCD domain-containing protein [Rhodococcus aetherivorans]